MRGEEPSPQDIWKTLFGSPPRARGRGLWQRRNEHGTGITPACAGKSHVKVDLEVNVEDHPRVRGEESPRIPALPWQAGSPPRARGRAPSRTGTFSPSGITPACAGKSQGPPFFHRMREDHPRVRGEEHGLHVYPSPFRGSPPRARGRVSAIKGNLPVLGITPACAGKRGELCSAGIHRGDHPRVRGEEGYYQPGRHCTQGSPPRARGRAGFLQTLQLLVGITPACAGKS